MVKLTTCFFIFACLLLAEFAKAQDPHFGGQQDMNTWYNPALKIEKFPLVHFNMRNVSYPNIISYTSKALTFELPFVGKDATDYNDIPFVNLSVGISTDDSREQFMTASTAMMSLSYALPLNGHNTYVALGLQGNYSFNRVGNGITYVFPDHFDKYGALGWSMMIDPYLSDLTYEYFSTGIGAAVFQSEEQKQWYIGGSVRYFNHPYTEWSHSAQLSSENGIQAGYTAPVSVLNYISAYGNFTWQAGINEQLIAARYIHHFNDTSKNAFSFGLGYRAGDALVPDAALEIGKSRADFYYAINLFGNNYHRKAFGFSFRFNFFKG
ncbi:MAG: hypothetical protein ABI405_00415 [Parafilimonas sp.]